jgi:hypothetical protein
VGRELQSKILIMHRRGEMLQFQRHRKALRRRQKQSNVDRLALKMGALTAAARNIEARSWVRDFMGAKPTILVVEDEALLRMLQTARDAWGHPEVWAA